MAVFKDTIMNGQLSYIMRDSETVPVHLVSVCGSQVIRLDLSENCLRSLVGLEMFPHLEEVILDSNGLTDLVIESLPQLRRVRSLSLNKNKVKDLDRLLSILKSRVPGLTYLSLLGNEACPDQLSCHDKDEDDYRRYRLYVLYKLPQLKFLDSTAFKDYDRVEAQQKGPYLSVVRVSDDAFVGHSERRTQDLADYRPLPRTSCDNTSSKATFGKCRYVYYGRHSEGNRFIRNNDL